MDLRRLVEAPLARRRQRPSPLARTSRPAPRRPNPRPPAQRRPRRAPRPVRPLPLPRPRRRLRVRRPVRLPALPAAPRRRAAQKPRPRRRRRRYARPARAPTTPPPLVSLRRWPWLCLVTQEQTAVEIAAASIAPGQPLTLEQQQIPWRLRQAAVQQHPAHQAQHLSMGPDGGGGGRGRQRHRGNPNGGGMDMGRVRRRPSPSPARPGPARPSPDAAARCAGRPADAVAVERTRRGHAAAPRRARRRVPAGPAAWRADDGEVAEALALRWLGGQALHDWCEARWPVQERRRVCPGEPSTNCGLTARRNLTDLAVRCRWCWGCSAAWTARSCGRSSTTCSSAAPRC